MESPTAAAGSAALLGDVVVVVRDMVIVVVDGEGRSSPCSRGGGELVVGGGSSRLGVEDSGPLAVVLSGSEFSVPKTRWPRAAAARGRARGVPVDSLVELGDAGEVAGDVAWGWRRAARSKRMPSLSICKEKSTLLERT